MIKRTNRMLVIIPFDLPWEHTADYTHQTARVLAKQHIVICYMQKEAKSIKEYLVHPNGPLFWKKHTSNIFLYCPLYIIPFRRFQFIEIINTHINIFLLKIFILFWFRQYDFNKRILWLFYPEYVYMIHAFGSSYISLYDCVDYHIGSSPQKQRRDNIIKWERELIAKCSYFFVNSRTLYDIYKRKRKDVVLVPQGFRLDTFQIISKRKVHPDTGGKPVIGYIGGINYRLDYTLLRKLIQKTPQYSYVFVGPIQENDREYFREHVKYNIEQLFLLPNVRHIDSVSKAEIPSVISLFDITIIPYDMTLKFNRYCYPMKLFEYFYMGKPVISTPIEELKRFSSYVRIGEKVSDWERHITTLLLRPWPKEFQKQQQKLAQDNSWESKISLMGEIIQSTEET